MCVGGGRKRDRGEERVILELLEQFVTLEWLLSYPGGPSQQESFQVVEWGGGEGLWSSRERSEVMAYSSPGGASVSWAGEWQGRKEAKKGGGRKSQHLPGLCFAWHAC